MPAEKYTRNNYSTKNEDDDVVKLFVKDEHDEKYD